MFAQRYELVRQRMLRQDIFQPKLLTNANTGGRRGGRSSSSRGGDDDDGGDDGGGGEAHHTLTPVESLLGRGGVRYLLGMIVQVRADRFLLLIFVSDGN